MTRPTLSQLSYRQRMAAHVVHLGSFWLHQATGKVYEVTGHHIREADGEPMVEYRPTMCDDLPEKIGFGEESITRLRFSRPAIDFFEQVMFTGDDGEETGPRFVEVRRSEEWVRV